MEPPCTEVVYLGLPIAGEAITALIVVSLPLVAPAD